MSSDVVDPTIRKKHIPKIRVVFMGTPDFAGTVFRGVLDAGYRVVAAYTKPDKPSGRKREVVASPVKRIATDRGIPVEQPSRFDEDAVKTLRSYAPDLILVAAYGKILPRSVLDIPGFGCVNVHASLLPRFRGASPVQNALLQGEKETGITLILMDEGLDTGDMLTRTSRVILPEDTGETLLTKLAGDAVTLLRETLPFFIERKLEPKPQDDRQATVCQLIEREDGRIFWNETAETIWNRYRGLTPWPGIFTFWKQADGSFIRLKMTRISVRKDIPADKKSFGEVVVSENRVAVRTSEGLVFLEEIQPEGKKPMAIRDFLNGRPDLIGSRLG